MGHPSIADRVQQVRERMQSAAVRVHRDPADIQLIAVSKGHPVESILEVEAVGQRVFGENYLAEAAAKMERIGRDTEWHMLGHVQSRKATGVSALFAAVHSVDSLALAERISRACVALHHEVIIFLECNISGEESKFGFPAADPSQWQALFPVWRKIISLPGLRVAGLMCMAPYAAPPGVGRAVFRSLRELRDAARMVEGCQTLTGLSMGMSDDFEAAIEEGATIVRIGRAIFGVRQPPKSQ
jgi:PLP dependent protein